MHITGIRLRRVREIERLTIDIGDRKLVPILGENGSGKSSILVSVVFAFTGKVLMPMVSKDQMVRDTGSGSSDVQLTFYHPDPDQQFVLTRAYGSSRCTLELPDGTTVSGSTKVAIKLFEIGLDPQQLERAFMPQGRAEKDLFLATPQQRIKALQEIYGVSECGPIESRIGQHLRTVPSDPTLEARFHEAQTKIGPIRETFESARAQATDVEEELDKADKARELIQQNRERATLDQQLIEVQTVLKVRHQTRSDLQEQVLTAKNALQGVVTLLGERKSAHEAAVAIVAQQEKYEADRERSDQIFEEIDLHRSRISQLTDQISGSSSIVDAIPDKEKALKSAEADLAMITQYCDLQKEIDRITVDSDIATKELQEIEAEIRKLKDDYFEGRRHEDEISQMISDIRADVTLLQNQIEAAKAGNCPTCGQEVCMDIPELEDQLEKASQRARMLQDGMNQLNSLRLQARMKSEETKACEEAIEPYLLKIAQHPLVKAGILSDQCMEVNTPKPDAYNMQQNIQTQVDELMGELEEYRQVAETAGAMTRDLDIARLKLKSAEAMRASLQTTAPDSSKIEPAKAEISAYESFRTDQQRFADQVSNAEQGLIEVEDQIVVLEQKLSRLNSTSDEPPVPAETLAKAQKLADQYDEISAKHRNCAVVFGAAQQAYQSAQQDLDTLQRQREAEAVNAAKRDLLFGARWLLHPNQFPTYVSQYYASVLNARWARELEFMNTKFKAWQDPHTLDFFAEFHNEGITRYVYQLSGGEQRMSSIAFQVVHNALFAPDVNWIGFDEPSQHLDAVSRTAVAHSLMSFHKRPGSENMQVFIIDHADELKAIFEDAIILEKQES